MWLSINQSECPESTISKHPYMACEFRAFRFTQGIRQQILVPCLRVTSHPIIPISNQYPTRSRVVMISIHDPSVSCACAVSASRRLSMRPGREHRPRGRWRVSRGHRVVPWSLVPSALLRLPNAVLIRLAGDKNVADDDDELTTQVYSCSSKRRPLRGQDPL